MVQTLCNLISGFIVCTRCTFRLDSSNLIILIDYNLNFLDVHDSILIHSNAKIYSSFTIELENAKPFFITRIVQRQLDDMNEEQRNVTLLIDFTTGVSCSIFA